MDEKLKLAYEFFYNKEYKSAKEIFIEYNETYEAGVCSLLLRNLEEAKNFFAQKKEICNASTFGLILIDIIQNTPKFAPKYLQVRSYLEIFLNLLIENQIFDWAQTIINYYPFLTNSNPEVPKFIARVLNANNYNMAVHDFAKIAKDICSLDAEIYYIDAELYLKENNLKEAKNSIQACLNFAPEYYPILKLNETIKKVEQNII